MMNAFRWPWETLFLLVTSTAGWTREALAIVSTTTCPNGRVSCPGFRDDSANKYCCPTTMPDGFYCCSYWEKEMSTEDDSENIPEIVGGVVGAVFLLASAVVLSCFFCNCCYIYKYRHRKRQASEPAPRRPSTNLSWRYRNWQRSSFPSVTTTSTCNGTSFMSSNRYYYSNRPLREAPPLGSSSYHHYQQQQHNNHTYGCSSPPRHRHESSNRFQHHSSNSTDGYCRRDTNTSAYAGTRTPTYSPYLYQPIHSILGEAKPFEAPPPYPIAQYYPTCPPISNVAETQMVRSMIASTTSPMSTSTSAATSSTVIQDDLLHPIHESDTSVANGRLVSPNTVTNDIAGFDTFVTYNGYSPKPT